MLGEKIITNHYPKKIGMIYSDKTRDEHDNLNQVRNKII